MCKICLLISGHLFEEAKLNRLFTKIAKFDPHNKFWESTSDVHNYFLNENAHAANQLSNLPAICPKNFTSS